MSEEQHPTQITAEEWRRLGDLRNPYCFRDNFGFGQKRVEQITYYAYLPDASVWADNHINLHTQGTK